MRKVILVPGTNAWKEGEWWTAGSPFVQMLERCEIEVVGKERPFIWTTDLDWLGIGDKHRDWRAGGANLFSYIVPPLAPDRQLPQADTNIICHSHGLQVVLYAAAAGLKINYLISVCSPVRKDMLDIAHAARPNIIMWRHIYADARWWNPFGWDKWQLSGSLGDGRFGYFSAHPFADHNDPINGISHSKLLKDPKFFSLWFEGNRLKRLLP